MALTIGMVANEPSGDLLGAALARALRALNPEARFIGVAGAKMQAEGCETQLPMERLTVMGLIEVLRVLPELLRIRRDLVRYFVEHRPDLFIGIDAPDFNLGLERQLRAAGIPTAHLVSPTVWAWRSGRVKTIRRSVDLMLSLFPFEEDFLRRHGVNVRYIGHPLADEIPLTVDQSAARQALGLTADDTWIALLPGSRMSEVKRLTRPLIETARWCLRKRPQLRFVVPLISDAIRAQVVRFVEQHAPALPITFIDGRSREVIAAADLVVTASGTATLETLLLKRPMLVAYKLNALTWFVVRRLNLIKVQYAAMANLLVNREWAPEFLQERACAAEMGPALLALLDDLALQATIMADYERVHRLLRRDAAHQAATALMSITSQ